MSRCYEPGWVRIGLFDTSQRRSLWLRHGELSAKDLLPPWFELCAGREGDDSYIRLENDGSKHYSDLWDVLSTAEFASES